MKKKSIVFLLTGLLPAACAPGQNQPAAEPTTSNATSSEVKCKLVTSYEKLVGNSEENRTTVGVIDNFAMQYINGKLTETTGHYNFRRLPPNPEYFGLDRALVIDLTKADAIVLAQDAAEQESPALKYPDANWTYTTMGGDDDTSERMLKSGSCAQLHNIAQKASYHFCFTCDGR